MQGYLETGEDLLEGHSRSQQFKFYMDSSGWPLMEYKNLCTNRDWLPKGNKGIRLWFETEDGLLKCYYMHAYIMLILLSYNGYVIDVSFY